MINSKQLNMFLEHCTRETSVATLSLFFFVAEHGFYNSEAFAARQAKVPRHLDISKSAVSRHVKQLEKMNLVRTQPLEDDPRQNIILLTPVGQQLYVQMTEEGCHAGILN